MTKKEAFNRLKADVGVLQPKTAKLFSAAGLPLPEEKPVKAKKKAWIPAVALTCTAAIAVAVCVPAYLHMQQNHGIVGGVTSSAPEEKKKLVWSIGGSSIDNEYYIISPALQEALDAPANEGKLFCIYAKAPLRTDENFVFEGESMASMDQKIVQTHQKIAQIQDELYSPYSSSIPTEVVDQFSKEADPLMKLIDEYGEKKEKICKAGLAVQFEKLKEELAPEIQISAVGDTSDMYQDDFTYYATLTREQIDQIVTLGHSMIRLGIPPRPSGYADKIADSLAAKMEYEPQETYFVRVNSVICSNQIYGNCNFNVDLIRELKDEEITQEFGDNFLAAIRERHKIEDKYVPTYGIFYDKEELADWYVRDGKVFGGFFEAKLTREEILELAEDLDVRSIYPAASEYQPAFSIDL